MSVSQSRYKFLETDTFMSIILSHRPLLIDQLQKEVALYLLTQGVLTTDEYEKASSFKSREHQISYILFERLPTKTEAQRHLFLKYLSDVYPWVILKIKEDGEDINDMEDFRDILERGEIPALPSKHVNREEEFSKLCDLLLNLRRDEYVVVHGMRGCGKSTVLAYTLNKSNSLIMHAFKRKVFWISAGCNTPTDELTLQQELYLKVSPGFHYNNTKLPLNSKTAKNFLKECFRKDELKDCLLILDDVSSASTVEAFDICCKIVITTDDKDVMKTTSKPVHFVKVSEGFTQQETFELLSQSTGIETLPPQAEFLHAICKGFPLTISLISSQLCEHKEDVTKNPDRWNRYLKRLNEGGLSAAIGRFDRTRQDQVSLLYKALRMSIDSLDAYCKELYQDFALFMNDVNIKPEVLCILWEVDNKTDIEDIMNEFERKCLVIKTWNRMKNSYVYSIHDLLLDYLKRQLTSKENETLHRKLIKSYQKKYGLDYNNFPTDDNYILLYLGYHLKEANYLDEFPRAYFDLLFIEKKIMNSGAADLLYDFRKYKTLISIDNDHTKKYEDFIYFITRVAACKLLSNSDIVQFALCESKESSVYKAAVDLKSNNEKSHLAPKYFDILTEAPTEDCPPLVYNHNEQIAVFAHVIDKDVLIANVDGIIRRINVVKHCTVRTFQGHTDRVTILQVSRNGQHFLSASDDATIRVWNTDGNFNSEVIHEKPRTPSPAMKQTDWIDPFSRQRIIGETPACVLSGHSLAIKHAQFANHSLCIVSTAADKKVVIWNLNINRLHKGNFQMTGHIFKTIETKEIIETCNFSNNDSKVLCAALKGTIYIYERVTGNLIASTKNQFEIKSMIVIPEIADTALLLGEVYFSVLDELDKPEIIDLNRKPNTMLANKRNDQNICAAVSWDGKYIAIASTNYSIRIYETLSGKKVLRLNECNGKIHCLDWSKQNNMLLASYYSRILKMWNVQMDGFTNYPAKLRHDLFDAKWVLYNDEGDSVDDGMFVSAIVDSKNKINLFQDLKADERRIHTPSEEICQICVLPDGDIVYACKDGRVFLISLDSDETCLILETNCIQVIKLKTFYSTKQVLVVLLVKNKALKFALQAWVKEKVAENDTFRTSIELINGSGEIRDFIVDMENELLYMIRNIHLLRIYNSRTGALTFSEDIDSLESLESVRFNEISREFPVKFHDISHKFSFVATGTDHHLFIRKIKDKMIEYIELASVCKVCKFSPDEKYIAVGFTNNIIQVFDLQRFPNSRIIYDENPYKFSTGPVIDISWSLSSFRFIVIFDREISLYDKTSNSTGSFKLTSILYMSVDKLISNPSFSQCVSVDSSGHFRVLKLPLEI